MRCIDLDAAFDNYMKRWVAAHEEEYGDNVDGMEEQMPEVYDAFLVEPLEELDGLSPVAFFEQYTDADQLIRWMVDYAEQGVPVPNLLLERIVDLGQEAEEGLISLALNEARAEDLRMTAVSLLQELESVRPMEAYIRIIADAEETGGLPDLCAESLVAMGEAVVPGILASAEDAGESAKDVFADVLSNFPGVPSIAPWLIARFERRPDKRALYASLLAKLGDAQALPALNAAAEDPALNYLDFIEIANAIEALGGERPADREFAGDPYYESLKDL